jgi:GH25 family lysozyme M1 (1,4-beta-N-acetylmuramidase)
MIEGIDVSSVQFLIDWARVSAVAKFAYIKGGEGPSPSRNLPNRIDPMAARHYRGAKAVDMFAGFYWFGKPIGDPIVQAKFFAEHCPCEIGDLPPALDLEVFDDMPPAQVTAWAVAFLTEADAQFSRKCVLYTYQAFAQQLASHMSTWWKDRPFWEAKYMPTPTIVSPLPAPIMHQYVGNDGRVDGILGAHGQPAACDRDRFFGTYEELAALCGDANDPY